MTPEEAIEFLDLGEDTDLEGLETAYANRLKFLENSIRKGGPRPVLKRREANLERLRESYPAARRYFAENSLQTLINKGRELLAGESFHKVERIIQKFETLYLEFEDLPAHFGEALLDLRAELDDATGTSPPRTSVPKASEPAEEAQEGSMEVPDDSGPDTGFPPEATEGKLDPMLYLKMQDCYYEPDTAIPLNAYSNSTPPSSGLVTYELVEGPGSIRDNSLYLDGPGFFRLWARIEETDTHLAGGTVESVLTVYEPEAVEKLDPRLQLEMKNLIFEQGASVPLSAWSGSTPPSGGEISYQLTDGPGHVRDGVLYLDEPGNFHLCAFIDETDTHLAGDSGEVVLEGTVPAELAVVEDSGEVGVEDPDGVGIVRIDPELRIEVESVSSSGKNVKLLAISQSNPPSEGEVLFRVLSGSASMDGRVLRIQGQKDVQVVAGIEETATHYKAVTAPLLVTPNKIELTVFTESPREAPAKDKIDSMLRLELKDVPFSKGLKVPLNAISVADPPSHGQISYSLVFGPATLDGGILTINKPGEIIVSATVDETGTHNEATTGGVSFNVLPISIWPASTVWGWMTWTFGLLFHPRVVAALLAALLTFFLWNSTRDGGFVGFRTAKPITAVDAAKLAREKIESAASVEDLLHIKPGVDDLLEAFPGAGATRELWNAKNVEVWTVRLKKMSAEADLFAYDGNLRRLGDINSRIRNLCTDAESLGIEAVSSQAQQLRESWAGNLKGFLDTIKPPTSPKETAPPPTLCTISFNRGMIGDVSGTTSAS